MAHWTSKEIERLRNHAGTLTVSDLSRMLNRSERAVLYKAHSLNISLRVHKRKWSKKDILRMKDLRNSHLSWNEVGKQLGRSPVACRKMWQRAEGKLSDRKAVEFYTNLKTLLEEIEIPDTKRETILTFTAEAL